MSIPHTNGQASSKTLSAAACPAGKPPLGEAVRVLSTVESQEAILRLATYRSGETRTDFGKVRRAAVLVALYERPDQAGLKVLMTTRAKHLRSHPGQSALPGGKVDSSDPHVEFTALREANEEVGLPLDDPRIYPLTTFLPFLSKYGLIVHAHVVFVADYAVIEGLRASEDEVDRIWEVPLAMFLRGESPASAEEGLSEKGSDDWLYNEDRYNRSDIEWMDGTHYRMHRFHTTYTPIKGLSSDILIETAVVGYGRMPDFAVYPDGQDRNTWDRVVSHLVQESLEDGYEERKRAESQKVQR